MLATRQIGRAREMLVQYRLLLLGIESSSMTTDAGIDLVAYSPSRAKAFTIQVKTNLKPKPSGGKGSPALDWWVPCDTPADLVALVDLSEDRIWMVKASELARVAQQKSSNRWHICMATSLPRRGKKSRLTSDFVKYLFEHRVERIFATR